MTDEQWKEIEKKLVPPFGRVELEIDGYKVAIVAQLVEKMKFSFVVYVNGFIRTEWSIKDCEIRRRFYYESKRSMLKKSEEAKIKKMRKSVREAYIRVLRRNPPGLRQNRGYLRRQRRADAYRRAEGIYKHS